MRFDSSVMMGLGGLTTASIWTMSDAFMVGPAIPLHSLTPVTVVARNNILSSSLVLCPTGKTTGTKSTTRLSMVEDEDEEDDDDDEDDDDVGDRDDPLGKGIDSVSWLPTVIGAKDMATSTSTREVSWPPPMRYLWHPPTFVD